MADLVAGTIKVDWDLLKKALQALDLEGIPVQYAIPVRGGGVEIGTLDGVKTWNPPAPRKKKTSTKSVSKP